MQTNNTGHKLTSKNNN